jgi:hypothetical protein
VPEAEKRDDDRTAKTLKKKMHEGGCKDGEQIEIFWGGNWKDNGEIWRGNGKMLSESGQIIRILGNVEKIFSWKLSKRLGRYEGF